MTRSAFKTTLCLALGAAVVILMTIVYALWTRYTDVRSERNLLRQRNTEAFYESDAFEATKARAQLIIDALERYHADNGRYPKHLDTLVPQYIDEIPYPLSGVPQWSYGTTNRSENWEYWLTFGIELFGDGDLYPCEYYSSSDREWHSDS